MKRPDITAIEARVNAGRFFCNKCGYFGPDRRHSREHNSIGASATARSCPYEAAEGQHAKDCDALIARVRLLEAERDDLLQTVLQQKQAAIDTAITAAAEDVK